MPAMGMPMRPVPMCMRNRRGIGAGIKLHIDAAIIMTTAAPMAMMRNRRRIARITALFTAILPR